MLYAVEGHPLLQGDALALTPEELQEQVAVAERALGLRGPGSIVFTGEAALDAARYVAMQVTLQASQDAESFLTSQTARGTDTLTYREGVLVHPVALAGVEQLYAELDAGLTVDQPTYPIFPGWRS